jgi:hypothetical protein
LPSTAFDRLTHADEELVRRYYGLDGQAPHMFEALAAENHQSQKRIRARITRAVEDLLSSTHEVVCSYQYCLRSWWT